jgi:hypothetical protein
LAYFVASIVPPATPDDPPRITDVAFGSPFTDYVAAWKGAGQARKAVPDKIWIVIDDSVANLLRPHR